jgi:hypothetical protein
MVAFVCAFLSVAQAQKTTGTITGTITDSTGAVVPDATVDLVNAATNARRTVKSNGQGYYNFPDLDPATYTLTVNKTGFKQVTERNLELHVADVTALNVQLQVGATTDNVEVEASPVLVETQTGTVANTVLGTQVRELPLNGRNFVQLTTLMPGTSVDSNFDNKNKGLFAGVDISFNGSPANANQWRVDGASNNDIGSQRTILVYPSIDGIEEFKISRNSYGPEYTGASGAQVNVVTKGGGNQFKGSVYYFGRNDVLNAKDYFVSAENTCPPGANPVPCKKAPLRRNDFGYTIGGPIKKDKLFFFFSEEWNRELRGHTRHMWVPSASELAGNWNDVANCPIDTTIPGNTTQKTHAPPNGFPGNIIPANQLSPGGLAYLSQLPAANITDPCAKFTWNQAVKVPVFWREESVRGDWNITKNTALMVKYTQDAWDNPLHAGVENGLWGDNQSPKLSDSWDQPGYMAVAKVTTTLNSTSVNDFSFSWSGNRINLSRGGDNPALNDTIRAAIPTIFPLSGKMHASSVAVPQGWFGDPTGTMGIFSPWNNRQDLFVWKDDFSKVWGAHTFKVGVLYGRSAKDEEQGAENGGYWGEVGLNNAPWSGSSGNFYSDMMLKGTLWGYGENSANNVSLIRWRDLDFYAGDSWKIHRRLTLEYGFRWQLQRPEYLQDNTYAGFRPDLYNPTLGSDPCNGIVLAPGAPTSGPLSCAALKSKITPPFASNRSLVPANNHLVAPRLGFAWDVFGTARFVLRGGIGQYFSRDPVGLALRMHANNTPFAISTGGEVALDGPLVTSGAGQNAFDVAAGGRPNQGLENNTNVANTWQWNLTTETALWKNAKLELGWVATRGIHLNSSAQINQIAPADRLKFMIESNNVLAQLNGFNGGAADSATANKLLPFDPLTNGALIMWNHRGDSIYHSLQAMFTTKFSRNSMFQASYTYSRNIADTTLHYVDTTTGVSDSYNARASRGLADFDRRQVFSANMIYNLPTLDGRNTLLRSVLGNWEAGSIINLFTGPSQTITGTVDPIGNPWGVGNGATTSGRPLRVKSVDCHIDRHNGNTATINPAAFTWENFNLGGYDNGGIGQCPGAAIKTVDFSLDKNWKLPFHAGKYFGEQARIQFRFEGFNLFNHPMFQNVNTTFHLVNPPGVTCPGGPGCITFTGNQIHGGVLDPSGTTTFGQASRSSNIGNRELQYSLKLIF